MMNQSNITLGNSGVGKTSIFNRLKNEVFSENSISTVGYETHIYYIKYKKKI